MFWNIISRVVRHCPLVAACLFFLLALSAKAFSQEETVFHLDLSAARSIFVHDVRSPSKNSTEVAVLEIQLPGEQGARLFRARPRAEETRAVTIFGAEGLPESSVEISWLDLDDGQGARGRVMLSDKGAFGFVVEQGTEGTKHWDILPQASGGDEGLHRVVRLRSDLREASDEGDDMLEASLLSSEAVGDERSSARNLTWRELQLVAVSSGDFSEGRTDEEVIARILATIAGANLYFEALNIQIKVVGVQIFRSSGSDPYRDAAASRNARNMLDTLEEQWGSRRDPEHDVAVLFAKGVFGNTYGLAYTAASCLAPSYSRIFATQAGDSLSAELSLKTTLAHELGHFVGMGHDSEIYPDGASLMHPRAVSAPSGFSERSIREYLAHANAGGNACFSPIPSPYTGEPEVEEPPVEVPLEFEGGDEQVFDVGEGQELKTVFGLRGSSQGVFFSAEGLPSGASFLRSTATLSYRPDYSVAGAVEPVRQFEVFVTAEQDGAQRTARILIRVHNVNRAPEYLAAVPRRYVLEEGDTVVFEAEAFDPDAGDQASVRLVGENSITAAAAILEQGGNRIRLAWQAPLGSAGIYTLGIVAQDEAGAAALLNVEVVVLPANTPPFLNAPEAVALSADGLFHIRLSVSDAELQSVELSFDNLPSGALVRYGSGEAEITLPASAAGAQFFVIASDGRESEVRLIRLLGNGSLERGTTPGVPWPGDSAVSLDSLQRPVGNAGEVLLYDYSSGLWRHLDCEGEVLDEAQFGGLVGDLPLEFSEGGQHYRALYRVISGQGYWLIDKKDGIETVAWGLHRDIPVPGDVNGNSADDMIVFRPSTCEWYVKRQQGQTADMVYRDIPCEPGSLRYPFMADIDGDGYDDRILFLRSSEGSGLFRVWTANGSAYGFSLGKGQANEALMPLVSDIDGDGRADFVVKLGSRSFDIFLSSSGRVSSLAASLPSDAVFSTVQCGNSRVREVLALRSGSGIIRLRPNGEIVRLANRHADMPSALTPEEAHLRRSYRLGASAPGDLDGDGRSNIAVWRPDLGEHGGGGQWFEREGLLSSGPYPRTGVGYGYPLTLDVQGAGRNELAVFSEGRWTLQSREQGRTLQWGVAGDIPVAGDYNGDAKSDAAVFRPSDSSWWIRYSGGSEERAETLAWGASGDLPVPADYNGDGKTDVAVWRPSSGEWFIILDTGVVKVRQFGQTGDIPVPGDYTGEGKSQIAVWRPQEGNWYILNGDTVLVRQFGLPDDVPLHGDYDGDGREDLAVWRPSTGVWFFKPLEGGAESASAVQFGLNGDLVLGNFRRFNLQ